MGKELFTERIIQGANKCSMEGVGGRPNTCPNNPILNPQAHLPKICIDCEQVPVVSTKNQIPSFYLKQRQARHKN